MTNHRKLPALLCAAAVCFSALAVPAGAAETATAAEAEALAAKVVPSGSSRTMTEYDDGLWEVNYYHEDRAERYEVKISPATGEVVEFESKLLAHGGALSVTLTEAEAKAAVTGEHADAEILAAWVEYDDGLQEYKVRFQTGSFYGKYTVHPVSGAVLEREIRMGVLPSSAPAAPSKPAQSPGVSSGGSSASADAYIGEEKAKQIALEKAPGSTVTKCKLDREDGRMVYEVESFSGLWEYEFEIDAVTGQILDYDAEYDD